MISMGDKSLVDPNHKPEVGLSYVCESYTSGQIMDVVHVINRRAPQGSLQGLDSVTAIFKKLLELENHTQRSNQLQLPDHSLEVLYGLSEPMGRRRTAQQIICNSLMKSLASQVHDKLKEESDIVESRLSVPRVRYRYFLSQRNIYKSTSRPTSSKSSS